MEAAGGLRVAIVAPPYYRVPPDGYGGTERVCAYLADGLVARGHDVTLVAVGGSVTDARLVSTFADPQPEGSRDDASIEIVHAASAARVLGSNAFDVVHDHTRAGPLTAAGRRAPTVVTIHSPVDAPDVNRAAWEALGHWVHYVAVSDSQRAAAPQLPWAATVHNGIPLDRHPFRDAEEKEGFALVLGRLSEEKGVHLAIDGARLAGTPLVLAGSWTVPSERRYFEAEIRPRLGGSVTWVGEVGAEKRLDLLGRASVLLFPSTWREPFGLVPVEAMACGTPVVALRRGALPELVVDGVTGVLCDEADPAVVATGMAIALGLRPADCRAHVERHFGADRMAARYEAVYRTLLGA